MEKQSLYLTPFQLKLLLKSLEADLRPEYRRRIEIMLLADAGQTQAQICEALGCAQETARYWIAMVRTGQARNWDAHARGRPKIVVQRYLNRLKEVVSHSPREYGYAFSRWTGQWLAIHLAKELNIMVSAGYINMLLKEMELSAHSEKVSRAIN